MANVDIRSGYKSASFFTDNPNLVLKEGQLCFRSSDGKYKIGDGSTVLSALTFYGGVGLAGVAWGDITGTVTNQTDLTTYLTNNYQPLDADLTSWAGITRASGFDTFVATPSSANLASLVTDETGSGALVFNIDPSFTGLRIGTSALGGASTFRNSQNLTGAVSFFTHYLDGQIQSDVTTTATYYQSSANTQAASFTLPTLNHFGASQGTFGAGSIVTSQAGFFVASNLTGAVNNYGFRGNISSSSGRWNLYMDGTAQNYLEGNLSVGTSTASAKVHVLSTTEQLRLAYDASNYITDTVSSTGVYTRTTIGSASATNYYGGNQVGSILSFIGTSANGTSSVGSLQFKVGNNGASVAQVIYNNGTVQLGTSTSKMFYRGAVNGHSYNRNPDTGVMTNSNAFGYQWARVESTTNTADTLGLTVYSTAGAAVRSAFFVDGRGYIGMGTSTPSTLLNVLGTTEQLRSSYDASNYFSTTVNSTGSVTFALTGTSPTFTFSQSVTARIKQRVTSIVSSATPTINTDDCDAVTITALATAVTSFTTNLSGTPNNFDTLVIRIKDDGTARALTWGASFEAKGTALPTTTVISKVLTVGFIYDSVTSKWGCVGSQQEA